MSEESKNFWATLPGIMTGTASLLTAFIALASFAISNCQKPKMNEAPAILNISDCSEISGTWNWFIGGEVTISSDGGLLWRQDPSQPQAMSATGRWTCLNTKPRTYALNWQNGLTDHVQLSPDSRSLSGKNIVTGVGVSGTRK